MNQNSAFQFRWQYALQCVLTLLPSPSKMVNYEKSIPWEQGIVFIEANYENDYSYRPLSIKVRSSHISGVQGDVLEASINSQGNHEIRLFIDGPWLMPLEKIAHIITEDKDLWSLIDDEYLFPEYSHITINASSFPLKTGRNGPWRERPHKLEQIVTTILRGPYGPRAYSDARIQINARPTRAHGIMHAWVSIRPPIEMPDGTWRTVYILNLRGGSLLTDGFRPGKWIHYVTNLVLHLINHAALRQV